MSYVPPTTGENTGFPPPYSTGASAPYENADPAPAAYYPPPQQPPANAAYYPAAQQPPSNVIVSQPAVQVVIPGQRFKEHPVQIQCPKCNQHVLTTTSYVSGTLAWLICLALFGIGFIVICTWFVCCIPFCVSSCKDVEHRCPNCHNMIGKYSRM